LALAEEHPAVARVLRLVDLMLTSNDEEIDWVAAYSALEIIEEDLRGRGVDGHARGWWTNAERSAFRATANSPEALGYRARHGKSSGLAGARMTPKEASWFVRRTSAHWLRCLQSLGSPSGH